MQVHLAVQIHAVDKVIGAVPDDSLLIREDSRSMANNAGHQLELPKMLKAVVTAIGVDLTTVSERRDKDFARTYIVVVSRSTDQPEPTE